MALLQKPLSQCSGNDPFARNFVPWAKKILHADVVGEPKKKNLTRRIPMSYITATSKERMGQKTHMRRRITTRIKTTLNLIVTRGAYVDQSETHLPQVKFDDEEASLMGEKWVMQGKVYHYDDFINLKYHTSAHI
jgi:hypothetical protein